MSLISFAGATLGYPGHVVLPRIDLAVEPGDFLAILGPNGSGKTTILRAILGILRPLQGTVVAPKRCGYSPQRRALDSIFPFTVEEVVGMGLVSELGPFRRPGPRERSRVHRALTACGVRHLADRAFRDLSGGQQQRTLVARALVTDPEVLILDEPTNDLDLTGEHEIMELVASLNQGGRTVVMVSHLLNVVAHYATRVAILSHGELDAGLASEVLTSERLSRLYRIDVTAGELEGRRAIVPRPVARSAVGGATKAALEVAPGAPRTPAAPAWERQRSRAARAGVRAASLLLRALPRELALELGGLTGKLAAWALPRKLEAAEENLEAVCPRVEPGARRRIAARSFTNRGRSLAELVRTPLAKDREVAGVVELVGAVHLGAALADGRGAIVAAAPLNGADLLAAFLRRVTGKPTALVLRRSEELVSEPALAAARVTTIHARSALREGAAVLGRNEVLVVPAHADALSRRAIAVPLLGRSVVTSTLAARLALRTNAPVLPATLTRREGGGYRLELHRAVASLGLASNEQEAVSLATSDCVRAFETSMRACPEEWPWHRVRWATAREAAS